MFSDEIRALILSLGAGLSTMLGALFIFIGTGKSQKLVSLSLGFAAGVMISVSFSDLLPSSHELLGAAVGKVWGHILASVFLALGVGLAGLLDHFVPHQEYDPETGSTPHNDLFRIGFVSMLAIGLHNFPEGIATFMAGYGDMTLGLPIAVAIALHNIPEGLLVAMPVYFATHNRRLAVRYTFLSGITEPAGALFVFLFLRPFINDLVLGAIFSLVGGIMLYIAIEELIPSCRQYGHSRAALLATFTGICLMPLTHIFI